MDTVTPTWNELLPTAADKAAFASAAAEASLPNPDEDRVGFLNGPPGADPILVRVVFLNGPPGAGKDTAGRVLEQFFASSTIMKMARRLKESVHADYGAPELPHDYFESVKDIPNDFFFGKTPRQAYIDKSEKMVKPVLGKDFYGRIFCRDLADEYDFGMDLVFITDSGFADECMPVLDVIGGPENALLIHVLAPGRGKSYASDSRSYIALPGVLTIALENNGAQADFEDEVIATVWDWLGHAEVNTAYVTERYIAATTTRRGFFQRIKAAALRVVARVALPQLRSELHAAD